MNPPDVFAPGIAIKFARFRVYGHTTVGGVELDPTYIATPGKAGKRATRIAVTP